MLYKIKSKPVPGIFTLIPYDNEKILQSYLLENYELNIAPATDLKNGIEVFQVARKNQWIRYVLFNVSKKFGHSTQLQTLLDFFIGQKSIMPSNIQIDLNLVDAESFIRPLVQALELSTYKLAMFSGSKEEKPSQMGNDAGVIIVAASIRGLRSAMEEASILVRYQMEVMNMVNAPANKMQASTMVNWMKEKAKKLPLKITVMNRAKLEKLGLQALLAVGQGSVAEPLFLIVQYSGGVKDNVPNIGLIGKGVIFDAGGLSIKPSAGMYYMKSDMAGAATVLGTICAAADLAWPVNLIAMTPLTENSVDATSIRPGDIIGSYSGKNIEVVDTDAEGRLILADALAYMTKHYEVDHIIDLATLTGSSVATFGNVCAALFSNDEELNDLLIQAGTSTGEKVWPLPLWDDYQDEMKSDIADLKNLSSRPVAGAITAAKFLQQFIAEHPSWAHLDIAGVAFGDTKFGKGKAATGWGVHLLCHFLKERIKI